jgi:hypothetical protein
MSRYPDFIERLLLHEDTLREPLPPSQSDEFSVKCILRIRAADDATLLGGQAPQPGAPLGLLRGGLYYFHNGLQDSHKAFADDAGVTAAYWHGMVHRREGDFENARYWMRRAGEHPAFQEAQGRSSDASPHMARQTNWDPFLFIHLCEQFKYGASEYRNEIAHLQRVEFAVFFDYVWRQCVEEPRRMIRP